ncbi:hypothetical protein GCM10007908_03310 [Rhizobium albus]|nr:hypothetical protein GCM10007908_03310 [Rhizobium albus]
MTTTRERRIRFIKAFGTHALEKAISEAVYRLGAENFLTDEQLDEIVQQQVADWRSTERSNRRSREEAAKRRNAA